MFYYRAVYDHVNMKIPYIFISIMEYYAALKKKLNKLKGLHAKIIE